VKRRLIVAAVIFVAALALLIGADRAAQALAERRIATEVQNSLGASQPPAVDLGPFPFLNEVAVGRVQTARVQLAELTVPNADGATATEVDATFDDVVLSERFSRVVASRGRATGLMSYDSLSAVTGLEVQYASPETVDVAFTVPIGRQTFSGTATGRPVLDADRQVLAFEDVDVTIPGSEGDEAVLDAAGRLVLRSVPLGDLPYDLTVTELAVTESGVRLGASGQNLPLR
jgi:hypothetical protein